MDIDVPSIRSLCVLARTHSLVRCILHPFQHLALRAVHLVEALEVLARLAGQLQDELAGYSLAARGVGADEVEDGPDVFRVGGRREGWGLGREGARAS